MGNVSLELPFEYPEKYKSNFLLKSPAHCSGTLCQARNLLQDCNCSGLLSYKCHDDGWLNCSCPFAMHAFLWQQVTFPDGQCFSNYMESVHSHTTSVTMPLTHGWTKVRLDNTAFVFTLTCQLKYPVFCCRSEAGNRQRFHVQVKSDTRR